jgi:mediator of RNA polymerase II transcription subunit 4
MSNVAQDAQPMASALLDPLNDLQSLAHTLFLSLSPVQTKPPPPPPLQAFLSCDQVLASAVNLAYTHQTKQRRIESLENEILELDRKWREICTELAEEKQELEDMIEEGDERIKAIEAAKKGAHPCPFPLKLSKQLLSVHPISRTFGLRSKP